jgi:hypothetical protein
MRPLGVVASVTGFATAPVMARSHHANTLGQTPAATVHAAGLLVMQV